MSGSYEWIDFHKLCLRVPEKSPGTLRKLYQEKRISSRQIGHRGKREFNWVVVERELAAYETRSLVRPADEPSPDVLKLLRELKNEIGEMREELRAKQGKNAA